MTHNVNLKTYIIGFVSSLLITTLAFVLAAEHVQSPYFLSSQFSIVSVLLGLAGLQFAVQLIYFLHLGIAHKQRLTLAILVSTISVVLIIIIGSIWIMNNLNYNMTPQQMNTYMYKQG